MHMTERVFSLSSVGKARIDEGATDEKKQRRKFTALYQRWVNSFGFVSMVQDWTSPFMWGLGAVGVVANSIDVGKVGAGIPCACI